MAGTTGSTGLNNLLTDSMQVQTTLPDWYNRAQQNVISNAGTALGQAPAFQNTAAQGAVNTLSGPSNPYSQGQAALNTIATGAANPWITSATGQVTPNTATPLGGLFAAENAQLNQLLPNYTAGANAAGIGAGQFGSLRDITGVSKAKADAQSQLFAQQMTAALQNQNAGVAAGTGLGGLGSQSIKSGLDVGAAQMNAPFVAPGNYANMINAVNVPGTVTQQNQMGGVSTLGALSKIPSAAGNLLNSLGITGKSFGGLGNKVMNALGLTGSPVQGTGANGGPGLGQITGSDGKIYEDPSYGTGYQGPNVTSDTPPPEALNPDGSYGVNVANPNSGWHQDQTGSWYNVNEPSQIPLPSTPDLADVGNIGDMGSSLFG
jgi:hypothetical protein